MCNIFKCHCMGVISLESVDALVVVGILTVQAAVPLDFSGETPVADRLGHVHHGSEAH